MSHIERAGFFNSMLSAAQNEFGKTGCYVATEHEATHYGIPLPSLALRFLLTTNILSLERLSEFFGPRGSGKSSLCYELARIVIEAGGIGTVVETENKTSFGLISAILGKENLKMLQFFRSGNMEKAMDELTYSIEYYKKNCPHKNIPYFIIWDSLMGAKSSETLEGISEDGHASKNFPVEANILSTYFGSLPDAFLEWPIAMSWTNHEKQKMVEGPAQGDGFSTPGGKAPGFYATYQTRVTCIKGVDRTAANPYMKIRFQTKKNNMGIAGRRIEADLHFCRELDEATGEWAPRTFFDWDQSTVDLLTSDDLPAKARIKEVVLVAKGETSRRYNCLSLGVRNAPASEVCQAIYANKEVYDALQAALSIDQWRAFSTEEATEAAKKAEAKAKKGKKKKKEAEKAQVVVPPPPPVVQESSGSLLPEDDNG